MKEGLTGFFEDLWTIVLDEFIGFRGLASHGAVIGVLTGLYLYQRKFKYKPLLWILDKLIMMAMFIFYK